MKIAFLILCHKNPNQINKMINTLDDEDVSFYLHIDKKSGISNKIIKKDNVFILDESKCLDIKWGQNQMIHATTNLLKEAFYSNIQYDYFWFMSGQDFPIKSIDYIKKYLGKHRGANYIDVMDRNYKIYKRFKKRNDLKYPTCFANQTITMTILKHLYILITGGPYKTLFFKRKNITGLEYNFGSSWWTLTHSSVEWMLDYLERHEEVLDFFDNSICPDKSLFQSLFMKTPYTNTRENIKVYLDWTGENRHPKTLTINDYDTLMNSDFLIARKFDEKIDGEIINKLESKLKMK